MLEVESEHIALENERRCPEQAERDKQKVREAVTKSEIVGAIVEAESIDAPFIECPLEAAKKWAASAEGLTGEDGDEFDRVVDLEAGPEPDAPGSHPERLRMKRDEVRSTFIVSI